jgi:hypothetical protein
MKEQIKQRNKVTRTIQTKSKVHNPISIHEVMQNKIIQRKKFEGDESGWHIHDEGGAHIKYGKIKGSRVDFEGKNRSQILAKLKETMDAIPVLVTLKDDNFKKCITWIFQHYT